MLNTNIKLTTYFKPLLLIFASVLIVAGCATETATRSHQSTEFRGEVIRPASLESKNSMIQTAIFEYIAKIGYEKTVQDVNARVTFSDIDDIIIFKKDGAMQVVKIDSKVFVGKGIIHCAVFKKKDDRTIYNMIYKDGKSGNTMMKRFPVSSIRRGKDYSLTKSIKGSKILYFTANPNGEAETITVSLKKLSKLKTGKILDLSDNTLLTSGKLLHMKTTSAVTANPILIELEEMTTGIGMQMDYEDLTLQSTETIGDSTVVGIAIFDNSIYLSYRDKRIEKFREL